QGLTALQYQKPRAYANLGLVMSLRAAALALLVLAGPAAGAERFPDMPSGRYDVTLDGMLCRTCLKAIVASVASLKEVEKASGDFDQDTITVTVRPKATLRSSKLQKAL